MLKITINMRKYSLKYTSVFAVFLLALGACVKTKRDKDLVRPASQDIMQILEKDAKFSTLVAALKRTELDKLLTSPGPHTLFAPNNDAFAAALGNTSIDAIPVATLTRVLKYHIYAFRATSGTFLPGFNATASLNGFLPTDNIYVTFTPSIADEAPTNEGFINKQVYAYMGCLGGLSINGIKVISPDIAATNGIIHEIGRVAVPPTQNLYEYIASNPQLERLQTAVDMLGLQGTLSTLNFACTAAGCGAYTAFLPTNEAFAAAGFPDDASINAAPIVVLTNIILYHVISPPDYSGSIPFTTAGAFLRQRLVFPSAVIANGQRFLTLSAPAIDLRLKATVETDGSIVLNKERPRTTNLFGIVGQNGNANNAKVIQSDVMLLNGIAHVVDRMLDFTAQP
jgi:uncharacterized surface protein with fasciclin (FAS1) repeats